MNLTRIYTRHGDGGETHLGDMSRVHKTHPRIEAYGDVDELNAHLGVALATAGIPEAYVPWLQRIQNDHIADAGDYSLLDALHLVDTIGVITPGSLQERVDLHLGGRIGGEFAGLRLRKFRTGNGGGSLRRSGRNVGLGQQMSREGRSREDGESKCGGATGAKG